MKLMLVLFVFLSSMTGTASSQTTVADTTIGFHQDLTWSPDGKWIVFSADVGNGYDLWMAPVSGSDIEPLTSDGKSNLWTSWSSDGRKLAFTSGRDGGTDLYVMDTEGRAVERLTSGPGRNQAPSWSPDQSHIAFMSDRSGRWQIFVMRSDGTDPRQVTQDTTLAHNPVWSPDGSKIVFYAGSGKGNDQVFTIEPNGKHLTRLTKDVEVRQNELSRSIKTNNFYPSWSPDGKRILFCSNRGGSNALYSMKADGSDLKRITSSLAFFGRWSPDGKAVAAIFGRYPHTAIGILAKDAKEPVWITSRLNAP
jgi:Tol biopolymer transport system component